MQPSDTGPIRLASLVGSGLGVHSRPEGLEIIKVFTGTSAEAAGLREGDLILGINGEPVHEMGCREGELAGQLQVLSYLRGGIEAEAEIETEALIP